jgi:hypothetical protein
VQEATELAELFQKMDAVFASGNLQRISSLLATMRRSLTMVGNVPEFDGGIQKLEVSWSPAAGSCLTLHVEARGMDLYQFKIDWIREQSGCNIKKHRLEQQVQETDDCL